MNKRKGYALLSRADSADSAVMTAVSHQLKQRRLACSRCGTTFDCGSGGRDGGCWCMDEGSRAPMPTKATEDCLCPSCLRAMASERPVSAP